MKISFVLLLLLAIGFPALSQPTLTAATSNPTAGLNILLFGLEDFNGDNLVGSYQHWKFDIDAYGYIGEQNYQSCSASNNCNSFPGSAVTSIYQFQNVPISHSYYASSATAFAKTGDSSTEINIAYSDPEDLLRYPMSLQSSFVDSWGGTYIKNGNTFIRKGVDSVVADAVGELKVYGATPNTLRVKRIQTYSDSASIGGIPYIIRYKATIYTWYDVQHKGFLFETYNLVTTPASGNPVYKSYSTCTNQQSLSVGSVSSVGLECRISPNPVIAQLHISLQLPVSATVIIALTNIVGEKVCSMQVVKLSAGKSTLNMNTGGLAAGVYILHINTGDEVATQQIVVAP